VVDVPLLRQSERGVFKKCQWAWWQQHVNPILGGAGIVPIVEKWKEAADFGTIFHVCMAEYYLPGKERGPHPSETWEKLANEVRASLRTTEIRDDELIKTWDDFYELGLVLTEAYVERYQGDPHWDVLDAERRFGVVIPDVRYKPLKSQKGKRGYTPIVKLVGTIDLCFRDLNHEDKKGRPIVKMVDHKTVGRFESLHYLTLDEQASTYISVATHALREQELIEADEVVRGMEYNFIKRAKLDTRQRDPQGFARNNPVKADYEAAFGDRVNLPKRIAAYSIADLAQIAKDHRITVYGKVSADQNGDNFKRYFVPRTPSERQRQIVRISEEARVMNMVRTGELPVLKTPTKLCQYCKFFDLCELDESGGDTEYFIQTTMKAHDPYADHREDAINSKKVTDASSKVEG
jgi:hypothetical protein